MSATRITFDIPETYGDTALDEVVWADAYVHLERLDKKTWMLIVEDADETLHLNVSKPWIYEHLLNGRPVGGEQ